MNGVENIIYLKMLRQHWLFLKNHKKFKKTIALVYKIRYYISISAKRFLGGETKNSVFS